MYIYLTLYWLFVVGNTSRHPSGPQLYAVEQTGPNTLVYLHCLTKTFGAAQTYGIHDVTAAVATASSNTEYNHKTFRIAYNLQEVPRSSKR